MRNIKEREYKKIHGTTKPGTLLKSQILLRVGEWEEKKPGFEEMDLVAHCVGIALAETLLIRLILPISILSGLKLKQCSARHRSVCLKQCNGYEDVCRSIYWALILIMTDRSSIIRCIATVLRKRSYSPDPVLTRKMIMRILNRRTGHA